MNEIETKRHIEQVLARFSKGNLRENGIALLNALGCHSEREVLLEPNTFDGLADVHKPIAQINREKAMINEWISVDILFQLTGDDIREIAQGRFIFDGAGRVDNQIIESYLFMVIGLKRSDYSRSKLADVTREINKFFAMPVMILFQHGTFLTLSIINRRLNKREENKDVLEKVTLIKGIKYASPLRAHIEILFDLSFDQLQKDTRFHNFVDLHHAWQKALDTSDLNKKFYREIANWYFWAVKKVEFPAGAGQDRETRNATSVIRLITRLIFVWFIKEKGLVPEDLFESNRLKELLKFNDPKASTYYKAILQNLFFATLNTEMGKDRRFRGKNKYPNGLDSHHGISTVYRYEDYFNNPTEALRLFENVPFLNGGLFECLDKRDDKILIDGFSDDPRNQPIVPDDLFFGKERPVDLNDIYGDTRHSRENVRGLIHIFNSYKFTIEENTPLEEEIALDPELLGKVFENLLAAFNPETGTTARKQTGSFYTPREIVNYMVDEALIAYLEGKLDGSPDLQSRLRHLLAYNQEPHQFNEDEERRLIAAIDAVNVLDPACGSGAFPMGVLHKLVFILSKLDPGNQHWKQTQIDKAAEIPDPGVRERVIEDIEKSFTENELDYGRKLYLIENCIYGVDIQPIAVQIAKLRFFISLIVDQNADRTRPNLGVRPLPNLETKFVAANTLIGIERPSQMMFRNPEIDLKERKLAEVRDSLFTARTPATKRKYRELDQQLRSEIAILLRTDGWGSAAAAQLAGWDPYDQNTSAGYFDPEWMFGISAGFDLIIGNPPYIQIKGIPEQSRRFYENKYKYAKGRFNIFYLFIELSVVFTQNKGIVSFIVPDRLLLNTQCGDLRKWLLDENQIIEVVSFNEQVFDTAVVDSIILTFKTHTRGEYHIHAKVKVSPFKLNESLLIEIPYTYFAYSPSAQFDLNYSPEKNRLIQKITSNSVKLGAISETKDGIIQSKIGDHLFLKAPLNLNCQKMLVGENVTRYSIEYDNWWVNYQPQKMMELERKKGGNGLRLRERRIFERKKILTRQTADEIIAAYDNNAEYFYANTLHGTAIIDKKFDPIFVLAILNSKLTTWFYRSTTDEEGKTFAQIKIELLRQLPIPNVDTDHQKTITKIANQILAAKKNDPTVDTSSLETEINRLVYKLYDLTGDEIAIVEGKQDAGGVQLHDNDIDDEQEKIPDNHISPTENYIVADVKGKSSIKAEPTDYGLYKCDICGQLVTGFMKDEHAQEKHRGATVEWKKISG